MANLAHLLNSDSKTVSHSDKRLANSFLRYWESLRGRKILPLITDLNLNEIGEFLPYTFTLDISAGSDNPKLCFVGRQLIQDCGGDLLNQCVSQLQPQSLLAKAIRHRGEVIADGKPCMIADELVNAEGNKTLYRAVMMPFSSTGDTIDFIIGAISSKTVEQSAIPDAAPMGREKATNGPAQFPVEVRETLQNLAQNRFTPQNREEEPDLITEASAPCVTNESSVMNSSDKVVLAVEDNAINMKLCYELLNMHGYTVLQATDGMEGLRLAHEHRPDLILMDMQLPEISGLEVTKQLKEDETLRSIPVIAVTALAMKGDEQKYRDAGCDAYIAKPISIANLLQTVEQFLSQPPSP